MEEHDHPLSLRLYFAAADALSPWIRLYVWQRALAGVDPWNRCSERLGHPTVESRPEGSVVWFHAASIGECAMAVPVVHRCLAAFPHLHILFTTQEANALAFLERSFLGQAVCCQFAPVDTRQAVGRFLSFWRPQCLVLMESELWPNLLLSPHLHRVPVALLNAHMSLRSFRHWSTAPAHVLASRVLSRLALVATPSTEQALPFQLLGANPMAVHFTGNLKFATHKHGEEMEARRAEMLKEHWGKRKVWVAASTHAGEEEVVARVHLSLLEAHPDLLTIIVPRQANRRHTILKRLSSFGLEVALRSARHSIKPSTQVYLADTTGDLQLLYLSVPLAFVGGSLFPKMNGHNFAEAAAASCAVITGPHIPHFESLYVQFQNTSPLSIWKVSDEVELQRAVAQLLGNEAKLNARCIAAKRASASGANGVVDSVWEALCSAMLGRVAKDADEVVIKEDGPDAELNPILQARLVRSETEDGAVLSSDWSKKPCASFQSPTAKQPAVASLASSGIKSLRAKTFKSNGH